MPGRDAHRAQVPARHRCRRRKRNCPSGEFGGIAFTAGWVSISTRPSRRGRVGPFQRLSAHLMRLAGSESPDRRASRASSQEHNASTMGAESWQCASRRSFGVLPRAAASIRYRSAIRAILSSRTGGAGPRWNTLSLAGPSPLGGPSGKSLPSRPRPPPSVLPGVRSVPGSGGMIHAGGTPSDRAAGNGRTGKTALPGRQCRALREPRLAVRTGTPAPIGAPGPGFTRYFDSLVR